MSVPTRVVLADDHPIVIDALRRLLTDRYDVLASASDGEALLELSASLLPDVVITDIAMPRLSGLDTIRAIRRLGLPTKVLAFTMHADVFLAAEALRAGALGFALKDSPGAEILYAVREVRYGRRYVSPSLDTGTVDRLLGVSGSAPSTQLSPRQAEILRHVVEGHSMKKAAGEMGLSRRTAESHKQRLMRTLRVRSTAELVQFAIRSGLVPLPSPPEAGGGRGKGDRGASESATRAD